MTSIDRRPRVSGHLLELRDQELDDGWHDWTACGLPNGDMYLDKLRDAEFIIHYDVCVVMDVTVGAPETDNRLEIGTEGRYPLDLEVSDAHGVRIPGHESSVRVPDIHCEQKNTVIEGMMAQSAGRTLPSENWLF
jgi:hypothetical protein